MIKLYHKSFSLSFFYVLILFLLLPGTAEPAQPARENNVKAVFIFNFTRFIEWPQTSVNQSGEFVIGILGPDPFGKFLDDVVAGESVRGRKITVHRYREAEEIKHCHILYINPVHKDHIKSIPPGILTVSDMPGFIEAGGMIRFFTKQNKIQLEINNNAAANNNLKISSKLLSLAKIRDVR